LDHISSLVENFWLVKSAVKFLKSVYALQITAVVPFRRQQVA